MNMAQARAMEETAKLVAQLAVQCQALTDAVAARFEMLERRLTEIETLSNPANWQQRKTLSLGAKPRG